MTTRKRKNDQFSPVNPLASLLDSLLRGIGKLVSLAASGIWWVVSNMLRGAWWMIRKVASGAKWLIHSGLRNIGHALLWFIMRPWYILRFVLHGSIPDFENARQEAIFWRIKRRHRRKRLFLLHSMLYVMALFASGVILVDVWRFGNFGQVLTNIATFMGFWLLVLGGHWMMNRLGDQEDEELGEAMEREYDRSARLVETYEEYVDGQQISDEIIYHEKRKRLEG